MKHSTILYLQHATILIPFIIRYNTDSHSFNNVVNEAEKHQTGYKIPKKKKLVKIETEYERLTG